MARSILVGSVALALVLRAGPAIAGDASLAEALFQEGKKLMGLGKFAEACPKLAESYRLDPGGGTLLSVAYCHEKEGKFASSWAEYKDAEAAAHRDNRADREKIARARIKALEPQLTYVTLSVAGAATEGFELKRDGVAIGAAAWSTPLPTDPGEHVFAAAAPGKKPWSAKIVVSKETKTTRVSIPELEDAPPPVASPSEAAAASRPASAPRTGGEDQAVHSAEGSSTPRTLGIVLVGVGVVGIGVGTVFAIIGANKKSDADAKCPETRCTDAAAVQQSKDAVTAANVANVGFLVGILAAGVGGVLFLTSSPSSPSRSRGASVHFAPRLGLHAASAGVEGVW